MRSPSSPVPGMEGLAAAVLAVAGTRLGGAWIEGGAVELRGWSDAVLALSAEADRLSDTPACPVRRLGAGITPDRITGGLDLTLSLQMRRPCAMPGLLVEADGGWLVAPGAERLNVAALGPLCAALDTGESVTARDGLYQGRPARFVLLALCEGEGEVRDAALRDRLPVKLRLVSHRRSSDWPSAQRVADARQGWRDVEIEDECWVKISEAALALGQPSLRLAHALGLIARALAALGGRTGVSTHDITQAAVLAGGEPASEATSATADMSAAPRDGGSDQAIAPSPARSSTDGSNTRETITPPELQVVGSDASARLNHGLLDAPVQSSRAQASAGGRGHGRAGPASPARKGAPAGVRSAGSVRTDLDLPASLKAAAPWRTLRASSLPFDAPLGFVPIRPGDLRRRVRRPVPRSTAIFVVDGSGSTASARLAEAKGAVERLLGDCYARRDQVALVQFRGDGAEVLLAPTRAIARARRQLSEAPAGGATPLAAGLQAGAALALQGRRRGETPLLVVVTDARANVDRRGRPGREQAFADALHMAADIAASETAALLVDISPRGERQARRLSQAMGGRYLHLPALSAASLADGVREARHASEAVR